MIENYKSEDGNGHIQSLKELVHVPEEVIVQLYQEHLSSFLEDITILERQKDMPI